MHMVILDSVTKIFNTDLFKKTYVALDNLSFTIKSHAITGFLGANGAGKTTCIKIILDFIRPTSGKIIFSSELGGTIQNALKQIGYLPERPYFYPHLYGNDFLSYLGQLSGMTRKDVLDRIAYWSPKLKIDYALNRKLHYYSKGMLQRIGFLAALIHGPKLLILDEPSAGLDPMGRKEFKEIIKEVFNEGTSIFFSSHIISDVEEICNELVFIKNGKLSYSGPLYDLITKNSLETYTVKYILGSEIKSEKVGSLDLNNKLHHLTSHHYKIFSVEPSVLSLEEIVYNTKG